MGRDASGTTNREDVREWKCQVGVLKINNANDMATDGISST